MTGARVLHAFSLRALSPRDRRAVVVGLGVLLPVLLYVFAVRPHRAAVAELRSRVAAERALLQREEALLALAESLPRTAESMQERADRATQRLVRAANVPLAEAELTALLENLAPLSRVLLEEMRSVEPTRRRGADTVSTSLRPIRLAVRGESDLEGVLTFLQRIEASPLLLRITELSIEPVYEGGSRRGGERRQTGVVKFALIVEGYASAEIDRGTAPQEASS